MNRAKRASKSIAAIFSVRRKKKPRFDPFRDDLPPVIAMCVGFLEEHGEFTFFFFLFLSFCSFFVLALDVEGIFRLSGEFKKVEAIIKSFEQGNSCDRCCCFFFLIKILTSFFFVLRRSYSLEQSNRSSFSCWSS